MAGFRDRKQTLQDILDKSLEHLNDDREVDFEGLSKRNRVSQSLQKMDDKSSWSLYDKINKCREYQKGRRFKERLSSAYMGNLISLTPTLIQVLGNTIPLEMKKVT